MTENTGNTGAIGAGAETAAPISTGAAEQTQTDTQADAGGKKSFRDILADTRAQLEKQDEAEGFGDSKTDKSARSQDGKFKKADAGATETQAADLKPLEAPKRWPEARRAVFNGLPREAQQAWLEQHVDWDKGYQALTPHKQFADTVKSAFTPEVRSMMQKTGLDEASAVTRSIQLVHAFETDPVGTMARLMQARGIDPRIFLKSEGQNGEAMPDLQSLIAPVVQPLHQKINELEAFRQDWSRQQAEQNAKATEATIATFAAEKDDAGSPKFPHLERVADTMAELLTHDPRYAAMDARSRLEHAYKAAVFSDPDLQNEIVTAELAKRQQAMERDRDADRLRSAATAKPRAASTGQAPAGKQDFKSMLRQNREKLGLPTS